MHRLKTILLLLLIAALPLQGVASNIMAFCASLHGSAAAMAMTAAADSVSRHAMPAHHSHHMDHADASDRDEHAQTDGTFAGYKHAGCGTSAGCASCCIGSFAPPLALFSATPQPASQTVLIHPSALPASFIAAGLDRPPKTVLA